MSKQKIPKDTAVTRNIPQDMEGGEEAGVRRVIGALTGYELRFVAADGIVSVAPNLGRRGPSPCSAVYNQDTHTCREHSGSR